MFKKLPVGIAALTLVSGHRVQLSSIPACNTDKGCLTETASPWKLQKDQDKQPKDYVVPNFGVDRDIIATKSNLKNAETSLKTKWVIPALTQIASIPACNTDKGCSTETASPWKLQKDQDKQPKDYVVPNFGVDRDILATKSNLKNAEGKLGAWVIPALAQQKSIPACNTDKGCSTETASPWKLQKDQDKQPKDYVVPNFGVDRDIVATKSNLSNAEARLGKWVIPALAQVSSNQEMLYSWTNDKQGIPMIPQSVRQSVEDAIHPLALAEKRIEATAQTFSNLDMNMDELDSMISATEQEISNDHKPKAAKKSTKKSKK